MKLVVINEAKDTTKRYNTQDLINSSDNKLNINVYFNEYIIEHIV